PHDPLPIWPVYSGNSVGEARNRTKKSFGSPASRDGGPPTVETTAEEQWPALVETLAAANGRRRPHQCRSTSTSTRKSENLSELKWRLVAAGRSPLTRKVYYPY